LNGLSKIADPPHAGQRSRKARSSAVLIRLSSLLNT